MKLPWITEFAQAGQRGKHDFGGLALRRLAFFGVFAPCRFHGRAVELPHRCAECKPETGDHEKCAAAPMAGFQRRNRAYYLNLLDDGHRHVPHRPAGYHSALCGYAISAVVSSVMLCLMNPWLFLAGIVIPWRRFRVAFLPMCKKGTRSAFCPVEAA
ncbi:MAG: hypothetical protein ACLU9S_14670 [Oscillospiraceae bacterium]